MKKAVIVIVLLGIVTSCFVACSKPTPVPSGSPIASASQHPTTTVPPVSIPVSPSASPVGSTSPSGSPATNPGGSPAASNAGNTFEEGKEVNIADIPNVKKAIDNKYKDAKIKSVTYAMYKEKEMYKVVLDNKGKSLTVYVSMDAKEIIEAK
ncbi:MAG: hypothetical protein RRY79_02595 [Clostridia bacterium]